MLISSFPGILPSDEVMDLLQLMISKNPDSDLSSKVIFEGGYNPCANDSKSVGSRRKRQAALSCADGFVLDANNSLCYRVYGDLLDFTMAQQTCSDINSNILRFEGESEVEGFMDLLSSCKNIVNLDLTLTILFYHFLLNAN
jgi:hypothetical protein